MSKSRPLKVCGLEIITALMIGPSYLRSTVPGDRAAMTPQRTAPSEKDSRTPAQQKINSQVLYEIYRRRGEAEEKSVPSGATGVRIDRQGRALVDVRVPVTTRTQAAVRRVGGTIVGTSVRDHSIIAWIPLLKLERLAANSAVTAIEPAAEAMLHRQPR